MNRTQWLAAGVTVVASLALMAGTSWFLDRLNPEAHPGELAYKPVDNMPPRIDLASVQRDWPGNLGEIEERNRLLAYQRDTHGTAPIAAATGGAAAPAAPVDLGTLLAAADAGAGQEKIRVCTSCHDFQKGGPNRIGPNLWGVVGRDVGSHPGFAYSSAMTAYPGAWGYDALFAYLGSPAREIPGTKMSFAGLRRPEDRAAVIKYLATLGNSPPPPAPQAGGGGGAAR